jgi:tetraacyldisaccharide 4'-kinase
MKAPAFWNTRTSILATLLRPLGALYAFGTAYRIRRGTTIKFDTPIICVGNLNAGGTGKTPTVIALTQFLQSRGVTPHIVSRGYGGSIKTVTQVNPNQHTADQTGDEPLLMAAFAITWISDKRSDAARAAIEAGADVILMDDGHQDPSLAKDLSIIVVDARRGFGNGLCLPAGPLREPIQTGLHRADVLISIGTDVEQTLFKRPKPLNVPHFAAQLLPLQMGMDWSDGRYIAFAGIGHPEKFFDTLQRLGANLVATHGLDDHQPLSRSLMTRLSADAKSSGAQLVTTEKDAVRLPREFMGQVLALPVRLEFFDPDALNQVMGPILKRIKK